MAYRQFLLLVVLASILVRMSMTVASLFSNYFLKCTVYNAHLCIKYFMAEISLNLGNSYKFNEGNIFILFYEHKNSTCVTCGHFKL